MNNLSTWHGFYVSNKWPQQDYREHYLYLMHTQKKKEEEDMAQPISDTSYKRYINLCSVDIAMLPIAIRLPKHVLRNSAGNIIDGNARTIQRLPLLKRRRMLSVWPV